MTVITNHKLQKHWASRCAAPAPGVAAKSFRSLRQRLVCCTLTGIDAGVPFETLQEISRRHSYVEFGVLYSTSRQGKGRYPSLSWISKLAQQAQEQPGVRLALHVCGGAVEDLLTGQGHVAEVAAAFPCIQLNFVASQQPLHFLCDLVDRHPEKSFITQHNANNSGLWRSLSDKPNHSVLFDESGGRGQEPGAWQAPLEITSEMLPSRAVAPLCGYAGGLGPDNLAVHLEKIALVTGKRPFWVDMETKLRDANDAFDIKAAQACLDAVEAVLVRHDAVAAASLPATMAPRRKSAS